MKNLTKIFLFTGLIVFGACYQETEVKPMIVLDNQLSAQGEASNEACWGQASAIFAQMGVMGEHAAQQPTPRLGLRNLARALYKEGIIPDDSMESLGAFVAAELGLDIEACQ